jgi:hypothetical protein
MMTWTFPGAPGMLKAISSAEGVRFDCSMALRSDPGPESWSLVTMNASSKVRGSRRSAHHAGRRDLTVPE